MASSWQETRTGLIWDYLYGVISSVTFTGSPRLRLFSVTALGSQNLISYDAPARIRTGIRRLAVNCVFRLRHEGIFFKGSYRSRGKTPFSCNSSNTILLSGIPDNLSRKKQLYKSGNPDNMRTWTFFDFLDSRGNNLIRSWLDSLSEKPSAKIDVRILFMESSKVWPEAYISALVGWPNLIELRIVFGGIQYRPICFYGPEQSEVTLLLGAIEKGRLPSRILRRANENRKIVLADRKRITRHVFRKTSTDPKL